jgi:hypothetical protein
MDVPFLAQRPYIQGGSIFNAMLDAGDQTLGPGWFDDAVVTSFKLQREVATNGRFVIADHSFDDLDPHAVLVARTATGRVYIASVDEGRPPPRVPYDEEGYYEVVQVEPDLRGEFALRAPRERADFMRGVVGANKYLHQKTSRFGGALKQIQFLYLKDLAAACVLRTAEPLRLAIANLTVQEHEREVWTVNRVAVDGQSFASEFRLCYRAAK